MSQSAAASILALLGIRIFFATESDWNDVQGPAQAILDDGGQGFIQSLQQSMKRPAVSTQASIDLNSPPERAKFLNHFIFIWALTFGRNPNRTSTRSNCSTRPWKAV